MKHYGLHVAMAQKDIDASMGKAARLADELAERGITRDMIAEAGRQLEANPERPSDIEGDPEVAERMDGIARALASAEVGNELQRMVANAHAFTFEGGIVPMLLESSAPAPERLPFLHCFLDCEFDVPETGRRVLGITIGEAMREERHKEFEEEQRKLFEASPAAAVVAAMGQVPDDFCISAWTVPSDEPDGVPVHVICNYREKWDVNGPFGQKALAALGGIRNRQRIEKACRDFVAAWCAMVNDPEVLVVETMRGPNARLKVQREHGAAPASSRAIRLTGVLRRYVQAQRAAFDQAASRGVKMHWVRGHFKRLTAERYVNKRGQSVWTPPHVRGIHGPLVRREYEVAAEPGGA